MSWLHTHTQGWLHVNSICHSDWPEGLDEDEQATLGFCRDWLQDCDTFTVPTSGSTGKPDKIQLTRKQMEASARSTIDALGLEAGDTALVCLNTHYIAGMMMLVRCLVGGIHAWVQPPSANPVQDLAPHHPPFDFTALVPYQLQHILQGPLQQQVRLNRMKAVLLGGAPVSPALETDLQSLTCPVYATFGMTETVSHIALRRLNGTPRSNSYEVMDGVQVETTREGCLKVKGAVTADQEITTNDVVELLDDKHFRWLGRKDHVINSGGLKLHPEALEQQLYPLLQEAELQRRFIISAVPDEKLGEQVVLVLEGSKLTQEEETSLLQKLKASMPDYHAPRSLHYLDTFPETPTGKIRRGEVTPLLGGTS